MKKPFLLILVFLLLSFLPFITSRAIAQPEPGKGDCAVATIAAVFWDDYDTAIKLYTRCIKSGKLTGPGLALAYNYRGSAFQGRGELKKAVRDYTMAVKIDPNLAAAFFNRAAAYLKNAGYDMAVRDYTSFIMLSPGSIMAATAYTNRGVARGARGEHEQAINDFTTAIALEPKRAGLYVRRGGSYHDTGDYANAVIDYDKAIRLDPGHSGAYYNRGLARSEQGDYQGGIADFSKAVRLDPGHAYAFAARGIALVEQGNLKSAVRDFTESIRLDPNYDATFRSRGRSLFLLGDFKGAAEDFKTALSMDETWAYSMLWLYMSLERAGMDGRTGLKEQAKRLDLNMWPGPVVSLYLGEFTQSGVIEGLNDGSTYVDSETFCEAYFYIGQYYLMLGQTEKAREMLERAVGTDVTGFPEHSASLAELGRMGK